MDQTIVIIGAGHAAGQAARIGLEDAYKQASSGELTLVDIRAPGEWAQSGVAPAAKTIALLATPTTPPSAGTGCGASGSPTKMT